MSRLGEHPFAVCLTHDVDRPFKRLHQAVYYALRERDGRHLRDVLSDVDPYWQFEAVIDVERRYGVRSAFYFLQEPRLGETSLSSLVSPQTWIEKLGRYDVRTSALAETIQRLHEGGWEVGLHGSRRAARDPDRLRVEKSTLEGVLGHEVLGGRQHHLTLDRLDTWRYYRDAGLRYDSSLGSTTTAGFQHGYGVRRPFDDDFVVFPLTLMDQVLPDPGTSFDRAWAVCEDLLSEAAANDAVMTVLWHPRLFCEADFPGYRKLYRMLIDEALKRDAWVGPPGTLYGELSSSGGARIEEPKNRSRPP